MGTELRNCVAVLSIGDPSGVWNDVLALLVLSIGDLFGVRNGVAHPISMAWHHGTGFRRIALIQHIIPTGNLVGL